VKKLFNVQYSMFNVPRRIMIKYVSAGESHGVGITAILEGIPAGLKVCELSINHLLLKRQQGAGRSERQKLQRDRVEILSGVSDNLTTGSPITLFVKNETVVKQGIPKVVTQHIVGHADYGGTKKFNLQNARLVRERASARESVVRVAAGWFALAFLKEIGVSVKSSALDTKYAGLKQIEALKKAQDTSGGIVEIVAKGLKAGIGCFTQWDKKLDANLARAVVSLQSVKGVEFGLGFDYALTTGKLASQLVNASGGIDGGMTNGQDIVMRVVLKPIPTVDGVERADTNVLDAAAVILECIVALELLNQILVTTGGHYLEQVKQRYQALDAVLDK